MNHAQAFKLRCEIALALSARGISLRDVSLVLRLGSKEQARRHVARGARNHSTALAEFAKSNDGRPPLFHTKPTEN